MAGRVQAVIGLFVALLALLFGVALTVDDDDGGPEPVTAAAGEGPEGVLEANFSPALVELLADFPERWDLAEPIIAAAEEFGVTTERFGALVWTESNWRTDVVSPAGAVGPAQVLPATADEVATTMIGEPDLDPLVPEDNLRLGAALLAEMFVRFDGDALLAHAAYHDGPFSITSAGARPTGLSYALAVEALLE